MLPYIGVTGFTTDREVRTALAALPKQTSRLLMVGVLASHKTLGGQTNKWPRRYPKADEIASIFVPDNRTLNLVHYHVGEALEPLPEQLVRAMRAGGAHCHGLQLNIAWPDPTDLGSFRLTYPDAVLVLQVGSRAMDKVGRDPLRVAKRLKDAYGDLIDYVLVDPSAGFGQALDPALIMPFCEAIAETCPQLRCVVAGGLGPDSLALLEPFAAKFPSISSDAEGRLRDDEDRLDLDRVGRYIVGACALLR
jgi:hypothetical protein